MLEHAQEYEHTCISLGALSLVSMLHVMLVRVSPMTMYVLRHVCEVSLRYMFQSASTRG